MMGSQRSFTSVSNCTDIVQCAFSLNDFEVDVFRTASRQGPVRADELADSMGRDRSTVYRALQKLMSCGMVFRETKSLEKGGYYHIYGAVSRDILKAKLEQCVEEWSRRMRDALSRFEDQI